MCVVVSPGEILGAAASVMIQRTSKPSSMSQDHYISCQHPACTHRQMQVFLTSGNTGAMFTVCFKHGKNLTGVYLPIRALTLQLSWSTLNKIQLTCLFHHSSLNYLCCSLHWETPKLSEILSGEGIPLNKDEIHSSCEMIFHIASEKSNCLGLFVQFSLATYAAISQTPLFPTFPASHSSCRCCAVALGSVCY